MAQGTRWCALIIWPSRWHQHRTGRNTLCNACGVKFANALRKVIGVGAGEYVAGPSEAAKIVRKRPSNHVVTTEKNKKYKVHELQCDTALYHTSQQMMDDMHHKHSKPKHGKKRRPPPSRDDEALTPGQRRSARPIKPSKAFENYSVYPDDESSALVCAFAA